MTMPRPSLVTSIGPSPVLGFMAAIRAIPFLVAANPARETPETQPPGRVRSVNATIIPLGVATTKRDGRRGPRAPTPPGARGGQTCRMSPEPTPVEPPVLLEVAAGVATIRFNRPPAMNALDTATKRALLEAVRQVAEDSAVRCVVLTGRGRAFCVGQDLREHVGLLGEGSDLLFRTVPEHYNPIALTLATMPKPVIAAVNGIAAGAGAAFAFAADLRIVAQSAGFNLAFTGIALSADSGSSWWLPRLVGVAKAKELLLLPRTVDAAESLALGLATEVVPDAELEGRVSRGGGPPGSRTHAGLRRGPPSRHVLRLARPGGAPSTTRPSS